MPEGERRLAAIMFTDMANYTGMSERDEPLAIKLLEEQRHLVRPIFARHGGREVKTLGDGFLVEFGSALEAAKCALEIQRILSARNQNIPSEKRVLLRIAIHVGDVEHRQGDIFGDAVNVASRVQEFADPGGVCITEQVFDHIRNNHEFHVEPLGKSRLKNVQTPIEIYKLLPAAQTAESVEDVVTERLRVAALPLSIISSEHQDEYLADGLTEEIINTISTIPGLHVIARTSVMKYKQGSRSVREIGRELKVGSILEGSVRKAGDRIRVTLQLIDVANEAPIWSQKYDRQMKDVFEIQTDIAQHVADALKVQLLKKSRDIIEEKAPADIAAYVLYLRGRYHWSKRSRTDLDKAIQLFQEAISKDPNYALAHAGLADCYTLMGRHRYISPPKAFAKARAYAKKALEQNDRLAEAHSALAAILFNYNWSWKKAENQFRRAIELNPNYATAHYWLSLLLSTTGRLEEAVTEGEKAQILDPFSPVVGGCVIQNDFFSGNYDKAIAECNRYLDIDPNFVIARDFLIHLLVHMRKFDEAEQAAKKLVETSDRKTEAQAHLPYVYASMGRTEEAKNMFQEIVENPKLAYSNSTIFITVYSLLGDFDNAFSWAIKARRSAKISLPSIRFSPDLKPFRADSRYGPLLKTARLTL